MDSDGEIEEESEKMDRKPAETTGTLLGAKMAELGKLKEKLMKAKDKAEQSWLDSRPFIDELEKLQSELKDANSRTALSGAAIPELESQLETLTNTIRAKKEEELKIRTVINRINQVLQRTQEEMEQLKLERDEKHRERLKLKQVLRLRRQTLRTLQLTLRAIRLESEADGASTAEANRYINHWQMDHAVVKLTQEEHHALAKRAREETSLAEWRISVSMEQKQVAKNSQDTAARRLTKVCSVSASRDEGDGLDNQNIAPEAEELHPNGRARSHARDGRDCPQKKQANSQSQSNQRKPQEQFEKSKNKKNHLNKKKKSSCFTRIRTLIVHNIKRYLR